MLSMSARSLIDCTQWEETNSNEVTILYSQHGKPHHSFLFSTVWNLWLSEPGIFIACVVFVFIVDLNIWGKILQKEIFLHRIWAVSKLVLEKYRSVPSHCGLAFSSIFPSVNQSKQISVVDGCCRDLGISSSVLSVCIPLLSVTIPLC